jgi:hypothetical protein
MLDGSTSGAPPADPAASDARVRERLESYRLPRGREGRPWDLIRILERECPGMEASLARLVAYDPDARNRDDARILLFAAFKDPSSPPATRERFVQSAVPLLRAALKDSRLPDEQKFEVGMLLSAAGVEIPQKEYEACFRNFKSVSARKTAEQMKAFSASMSSIESILVHGGLIEAGRPVSPSAQDFRDTFSLGTKMAGANPEAGGWLLSVVAALAAEHGKLPLDVQAAILAASRTGTPVAAWCLEELGAWPALGSLGDKARVLAAEMRASGLVPSLDPRREFSHGIVSNVDGMGSRSLALFFRALSGAMDALVVLLNDSMGVKDAWCVYEDGADIEPDMRRQKGVVFAQATMPIARELVADALAIHAEQDVPPPGRLLLYRPLLGADPILPRRRQPDLGAYALESLVRGPALAEGSEALCKNPVWEEFWFSGDEAYDFLSQNFVHRSRPPTSVAERRDLEERFIREAAVGECGRLVSRMAACLETEAWAGRQASPTNKLAARTWLALSEGVVPFHEVPYVRVLAQHAIAAILNNLLMGFHSQRDVNATRNA